MTTLTHVTMEQVAHAAKRLAERNEPADVYGIPRGGIVPASIVATIYGTRLLDAPEPGCLVVDDLVDTGATLERYAQQGFAVDALFRKPSSPDVYGFDATTENGWLVFPWEVGDEAIGPTDAVVRLLQYIGEDAERDGLLDTPKRVVKALAELTSGYALDPADVLGVQFEQDDAEQYHGIVLLRGIPFSSLCEHHMLPFTGVAHVAYIPKEGGRVVGLSKLARLVDIYARRLQVQERMTVQIVNALVEHVEPFGAACIISASHSCMSLRGVSKHTDGMVTSELAGAFKDDARARDELLRLIGS